jgi:hypothetical protein
MEGDDDLQLIRASAGLLSDLQSALSKLLWKSGGAQGRRVHHLVRLRDLEHVIQLVCLVHGTWIECLLIYTDRTFPRRPSTT